MKAVPIRTQVARTRQVDPKHLGRDHFIYVDISSIDRDMKSIRTAQQVSALEAPSRARKLIEVGDVLVSTVRPNLNAVALVSPELSGQIASTGFCVLRPVKTRLDNKYLFYFCQNQDFIDRLTRLSIGAGYPAVTDDNILDADIPLPPLPDQQRIAGILSRADRLRRLRRYALEMSDGYLQAVFLEMFGEALSGKGRTVLVPISSVCKKITDGTHVTPKYLDSGVPFLSVKNLTKTPGSIDFTDTKHISREEHERISRLSNVERGDILYTKVGTYGIPQLVDTDTEFSIFVSVALLKPNASVIIPKFFEVSLRTDFVKKQAKRLVSGIGVPDLHLREIKTMLVPLPSMVEQERFVELAQRYEHLRAQQREALRQAEHLFQTLLHGAFRGGLDHERAK